jgi:TonB family protein
MMTGVARIAAAAVLVCVSAGAVFAQRPPRVRVGGDVKAPIKLTHVSPAYPDEAKAERAGGTVVLEIVVATDGSVLETEALRRVHPLLDDAAAKAVGKWKYTPTELNGEPAELIMIVTVTFVAPE